MGAPVAGSSFGYAVGGIFIFNLIVGTGSLSLPASWNDAGLIAGLLFTFFIFVTSYMTVTFIIEVQSVATVLIDRKDQDKETTPLNAPINLGSEDEALNGKQLYDEEHYPEKGAVRYYEDEGGKTAFFLKQVELGTMAETLMGKAGLIFFYLVLIAYLYGDLAIYAVAVPQSVQKTLTPNGLDIGSLHISALWCYEIFLAIYAVLVLPFCLVNFSNSKYLQFFTIIFRNVAFLLMIGIAFKYIIMGEGPSLDEVNMFEARALPALWGTVIYCFMCHHSIPGLISPLQKKRRVNILMFLVYCGILGFYILLASSALFAFGDSSFPASCDNTMPCQIQSLYTYNFVSASSEVVALFLGLFPVFTISANYPLIAITLRNNLMRIPWAQNAAWAQGNNRRQYLFAMFAAVPSLIVAAFFQDVDALVSLTGSYAGLFIELVIPAVLVYQARKVMREQYPGEPNPYRSPFQSIVWLIIILVTAAITLVVVTINNGYTIYEWIACLADSSSSSCSSSS